MSDYDMANSDPSTTASGDDPNIERDDTDGGAGSGVDAGAAGTGGPDLPGEEPVDLDDDGLEDVLDDMGDDPGDDGNPLLQQNL